MTPARPPNDLAHQALSLQSAAVIVFRLWQKHHPSALFWSKKGIYRFDSKSARYGVLYTSGSLEGALLEVFGDQWVKRPVISQALLAQYSVSILTSRRQLSLVDTTGSNLNKLGVDSGLFASLNYGTTRSWARAFMEHPANPDGIIYHSRKNPLLLNYAFFETTPSKVGLVEMSVWSLAGFPGLGDLLDRYEVSVV
jgi:hypothetical protein